MPISSWAAIEPPRTSAGVTHKTVKRAIQRGRAGTLDEPRQAPPRGHNTDTVNDLIWERVDATKARITASACWSQRARATRDRRATSGARLPRPRRGGAGPTTPVDRARGVVAEEGLRIQAVEWGLSLGDKWGLRVGDGQALWGVRCAE